jgi:hypothetical protein
VPAGEYVPPESGGTNYDFNLDKFFDVELGRPQDYAYTYSGLSNPSQKILDDAFNNPAAGITPDTGQRIRDYFTPETFNRGPQAIRYG